MRKFFRNENGLAGIEFSIIAPMLAVVLLGITSGFSFYQDLNHMRDGVEAAAKYYIQGGSNDVMAQTIATTAWKGKPVTGTVTVTRSCICNTTSVSCATDTACADASVPQIQITLLASNTWTDNVSSIIFRSGIEQRWKETVRVR